jgi:uncharacterized membrane protein
MTKRIDLTGGFWWALLLFFTVLVTDNSVIRLILSLPLVFFLTGHTVVRAIRPQTTGPLEHVVFAVGTSIAVCVGGGFLLNLVWLLTPVGWAVWFLAVNGVAALFALCQPYEPILLPAPPRIRLWQVFTLCAALGIATASFELASYIVTTSNEFKYTEFWVVPQPSPGKMAVGIESAEGRSEQYEIEVTADKSFIAVFRSIDLAPGQKWIHEIAVGLNQKRVEANLYRTRDHVLYRKVSALIPSAKGPDS